MTTRKISLAITTALTSVLIASSPANAQGNDEVIVTATKRQQSLQSTPVAVTVTSADTIEKTQILDIADLQSVVPSLRVTQLQSSVNTNFIIRGYGNGANNAGIEPSVGVFIDGVYRSRSAAQIGDLPKLQRVEVLRGPQSTLFGKNASAGVISIATAKPSYDKHGYIEAGIGNYNLRLFRGYFTGPLGENISASIGGSLNNRDGHTTSVLGLNSINDRDRWNLRGQLLVEPTDNVTVRVIADISEIDESCCTVTNVVNGPTAGAIMLLGGTLADPNDPFSYVAHQNNNSINAVTDKGISVQADIEFDKFTLTSISAFRKNESFGESDTDFTTLRILDSTGGGADINTYTQELRLTSTGENTLDWMLGGYVFKEDINQTSFVDVGDDFRNYVDLLAGGPSVLAGIEGLYGFAPGSFFPGTVRTLDTFTQDNTAYSAFATVDLHATDQLTLTGGLNYTNDKKTVTGNSVIPEVYSIIDLINDNTVFGIPLSPVLFGQTFTAQTGLAPTPTNIAFIEGIAPGTTAAINAGVADAISGLQGLQFLPQFLAFPNSVENGQTDEDKLTWTARAAYEISDNINVYASAATGFKATSWNLSRDSRPFASDLATLTAAGLTLPNQTTGTRLAGPENAMVFELGAKARFSRGAINIAVFDQKIDDFQSNTFLGTGFVLSNAGKTSVKGIEIDGTFTPVDPLTLTFAATLLDPKYDLFVNAPGPNGTIVDRSGETVAGIPKTSIATSATYNFEFGDGHSGFIRGDYQYESEVNVVEVFDVTRSVNVVNASAGITTEGGFGIQVWARNIFNDEYFLSAFPGVVQTGTVNSYPNAPRTYGVSLRKEF